MSTAVSTHSSPHTGNSFAGIPGKMSFVLSSYRTLWMRGHRVCSCIQAWLHHTQLYRGREILFMEFWVQQSGNWGLDKCFSWYWSWRSEEQNISWNKGVHCEWIHLLLGLSGQILCAQHARKTDYKHECRTGHAETATEHPNSSASKRVYSAKQTLHSITKLENYEQTWRIRNSQTGLSKNSQFQSQ